MSIIPILRREMVTAARQGHRLHSERHSIAQMLFLIVGGSFAAWWYWAGGVLDSGTMARISDEALRWSVAFQGGIVGSILIRGALAITREREGRTLDFVLITPMSSAEIVLGKLAACVAMTLSTMAVGLPILLLVHTLGGVELRVILLAYAGLFSMDLFLSAMAIWMSAEMPDRRSAGAIFVLGTMAWLIGPFSVATFLPRWGIQMPASIAAANWGLASTSPVVVAFHIATGLRSWDQLVGEVGRMIALQLGAAAIFTIAAIVRLRPAHRSLAGGDQSAGRKARRRLSWRWRPRPPVDDDPILWREKYTTRESGLMRAANLLIFGGLAVGLGLATYFYARLAFVELWHHGYPSASIAKPPEEVNVLLRLFMPLMTTSAGGPIDLSRMEFNHFIRYATVAILVIMSFMTAGIASEILGVERVKDTWTSLLATPLTSRDILRSALLATAWRSRHALAVLLALWMLGMAAGAIHPLGFLVSWLEVAASAWLMAVLGVLASLRAGKAESAPAQGAVPTLVLTTTGVLPLLLPPGLNPVLLGAGSLPLMAWTSLVSYREMASALAAPLDPHFPWVGLPGGQIPLLVFISWLVAILGPAGGGLVAWRYAVAHFDRLVGRPHRAAEATEVDTMAPLGAPTFRRPPADPTGRRSPLAEADGAL
jgi:ABC-2 family transporter protein